MLQCMHDTSDCMSLLICQNEAVQNSIHVSLLVHCNIAMQIKNDLAMTGHFVCCRSVHDDEGSQLSQHYIHMRLCAAA